MRLFGFNITRSAPRDPAARDEWLLEALGGGRNSAGVPVSPSSAQRAVAVYACIRVLAESVATLPLMMYRRLPDGSKEKATEHPLYTLVHRSPNTWQTASEFRDVMQSACAAHGAAYARIVRRPDRWLLLPLQPDTVEARLTDDYQIVYRVRQRGGFSYLLQDEVLRIPYVIRDGVEPVSPIRLQAETIGQALLSTQYTNQFLKNGGRPPGVIKLNAPFKDQIARDRFREALKKRDAGETMILEAAEYSAIGISNADAQLLDIKKMSILDICRIYRMPPHMVGDLERATWNNVEQQGIDFVVHTLGPWLARWEQALSRDLLTDAEREEYYFEFNVAGLLRGDMRTQAELFAKGRQWGWFSINDIRAMLNMNAIEDGDDYLSPTNMVPAWQVGQQPEGGQDNGT